MPKSKKWLMFLVLLMMTTFVYWILSYDIYKLSDKSRLSRIQIFANRIFGSNDTNSSVSLTPFYKSLTSLLSQPAPTNMVPKVVTPSLHPDINIVDVAELVGNSTPNFQCPMVRFTDKTFPLCTYTAAEDIHVSGSILRGHYWETDLVWKMINFLQADKELLFIDIGANIGAYTLAAAHCGFQVLAVEPNSESLQRLSRSIVLGKVVGHSTLLYNAISNGYATTALERDPRNQGDTYLSRTNTTCVPMSNRCLSKSVKTITLNDLIPFVSSRKAVIKIDVQGSEIKVFDPITASRFFTEVDVQVIQMEWEYYKNGANSQSTTDEFLNFFRRHNYTVHNTGFQQLSPVHQSWPQDIYMMKQRATERSGRSVVAVPVNRLSHGTVTPGPPGVQLGPQHRTFIRQRRATASEKINNSRMIDYLISKV